MIAVVDALACIEVVGVVFVAASAATQIDERGRQGYGRVGKNASSRGCTPALAAIDPC